MSQPSRSSESSKSCPRCFEAGPPDEVRTTIRFVYKGSAFEVENLCPAHSAMLDRDFRIWTRIAREVTIDRTQAAADVAAGYAPSALASAPRPDRQQPGTDRARVHVPAVVARGEVIDHDAADQAKPPKRDRPVEAMPIRDVEALCLTDHAIDRMRQRHISTAAVWDALRDPATEVVPQAEDDVVQYRGDQVIVTVNEQASAILTVGHAPNAKARYAAASSATD